MKPNRLFPQVKKHLSTLNSYFSIHNSSSGFALVGIVVVILLIFSIMMVTGSATFPDTPDLISNESNPKTSPSPDTSVQWSITHEFLGCKPGDERNVKIIAYGPQDGYISIEIESTSGTFRITNTGKFSPTSGQYPVTLSNDKGFNTKIWRLNIFSGGTVNNDQWSDGELQSTSNRTPTGC